MVHILAVGCNNTHKNTKGGGGGGGGGGFYKLPNDEGLRKLCRRINYRSPRTSLSVPTISPH